MNMPSHNMISVNKKPTEFEIAEMCHRYFSSQSVNYDDFDRSIDRRRLYCDAVDARVITILREFDVKSIISFGCGTGRREQKILSELKTAFGTSVRGVEADEVMASQARIRGIDVRGVWPANWEDGCADAVIVLSSFVHLSTSDERKRWLSRFARALKDGGVLILDVFNLHDKTEWGPEILRRHQSDSLGACGYDLGDVFYVRRDLPFPSFMHYFTVSEITGLLESVGFRALSIEAISYGSPDAGRAVPLDQGNLFLVCSIERSLP